MIVDASVAAKWVLWEPGSEEAIRLQQYANELMAPTLVVAEIGNAIWKRAVRDELSTQDAVDALQAAIALYAILVELAELAEAAAKLSISLRHPIYDCFYIALAQRERAELVTADERMATAARKARIKVRRL